MNVPVSANDVELEDAHGHAHGASADDHGHSHGDSEACPREQRKLSSVHLDMLSDDDAMLANFDAQGAQPYSAADFNMLKVLGQGGFGKVCHMMEERTSRRAGVSGGAQDRQRHLRAQSADQAEHSRGAAAAVAPARH